MRVTQCDKCGRQAVDEGLFARIKVKRLPVHGKYRLEKPMVSEVDGHKMKFYTGIEPGECEWELCPMCAAEMLKFMIPDICVQKERLDMDKKATEELEQTGEKEE